MMKRVLGESASGKSLIYGMRCFVLDGWPIKWPLTNGTNRNVHHRKWIFKDQSENLMFMIRLWSTT